MVYVRYYGKIANVAHMFFEKTSTHAYDNKLLIAEQPRLGEEGFTLAMQLIRR